MNDFFRSAERAQNEKLISGLDTLALYKGARILKQCCTDGSHHAERGMVEKMIQAETRPKYDLVHSISSVVHHNFISVHDVCIGLDYGFSERGDRLWQQPIARLCKTSDIAGDVTKGMIQIL